MTDQTRTKLADLLLEAGRAHHTAFVASNGADPDWPIWYADYLQEPLAQRFNLDFDKSRLIFCLINADTEHQTRSPDSAWAEFYADVMLECYALSDSPEEDKLALYHYNGCPYCSFVRSSIDRLGIDVEWRDIFRTPQHRDDLMRARGRATVPVLRIMSPNREDRWMPESRDIVRYLQKSYA
jgi:glutaredoxin